MHAVAVICKDPSGNPIPGMIVQLVFNDKNILAQGMTNQDGYVLFNFVPINIQVVIFAWGAGYNNLAYPVKLGDQNQNIDVTMTPSFNKPSRDRIINVKANLCNLHDADGIPIFEPMINSLILDNPIKAQDWVNKAKQAGSTHYNMVLTGRYPGYPVEGTDFTNDFGKMSFCLDWIRSKSLIPILKLGFDGQKFSDDGWTYGWKWGIDNIKRIASGLSKYNELILWSTGFDGCFPDWTPDQTIDMLRKMRSELGNKACIDTEFAGPGTWGYIHLGNGEPDWRSDKLGILDHFSLEAESFPPDTGDPLQQIATRLLGPNCLIGPQTPYYLADLDKTIAIDVYETVAYWFVHGQASSQDAIDVANKCSKYGFKCFGNGVPSI